MGMEQLSRTMGSIFISNEELVKKDDDHKPTKIPPIRPAWSIARVAPRKALKRIAIALAVGVFIYIFIHNIPTDVPIRDRRRPSYAAEHADHAPAPPKTMPKLAPVKAPDWNKPTKPSKSTKPNKPVGDTGAEPASAAASGYDGPIAFKKLAASLQSISSTRGDYNENKNILFVASSLKSAAILLPMACQMGAELRNYVHFALMSRSEISMEELLEVNGVDDSCHIIAHDARPDYAATGTEQRFMRAVMRGMYHTNVYMHPQAVFIDASGEEPAVFLEAMRIQVNFMGMPLIELPENGPSQLTWLSKLDSSSLANWHKLNIEILIHVPHGSSGNLVRLLKSLAAADFSGSAVPHITIELPTNIDQPTANYLKTFQWPPAKAYNPTHAKQLTLRHRIPRRSVTEEESSVRFLESFWPADPTYSHVLVLSPQAELSPSFFHYIKYTVLEYIYSSAAITQQWDSRLFGISLDLPLTHLNSKPFTPPTLKKDTTDELPGPTSFLWQAPSSNAVLYPGEKWIELHAFVSRLLELQHNQQTLLPALFSDKLVSKRYPSWLEHALKLSRARGYWTLYPSRPTAEALAMVHNELYRAPEEYESELGRDGDPAANEERRILDNEAFLDTLPGKGSLLPFDEMPLLSWDGKATELMDLDSDAAEYAAQFRKAVGGCERLTSEELLPRRSARDLFCVKDD